MARLSRCTSSMKKTEPGSSAVRKAAMSALRSSAGPAVCTSGASSSAATMLASDVLPRPGGPASSTWSSGSPRRRAASMNTSSCAVTCSWLTKSPKRLGRSDRSKASSSPTSRASARRSSCSIPGSRAIVITKSTCQLPRTRGLRPLCSAPSSRRPVGSAPKRGLDQLLGALAVRAVEEPLGLGQRVAQVHEAVTGQFARAVLVALLSRRDALHKLARDLLAQLDDQPFGGSLADAGGGLEALRIPGGDRPHQLPRRPPREDGDRHLGANSGDRGEVEEEVALLLARETVQRQRVLARHEMCLEGCLLAPRGDRLERLHGNRQAVADAGRLDHHVVRAPDQNLAANRGDHPTGTSGAAAWSAPA